MGSRTERIRKLWNELIETYADLQQKSEIGLEILKNTFQFKRKKKREEKDDS